MVAHALAMIIVSNAAISAGQDCEQNSQLDEYHVADVCSDWIKGEEAYSATMRGNLVPKPASQQVLMFKTAEGWRMRIAGYRWDMDDGSTSVRRREFAISLEEANRIKALVTKSKLQELSALPFYGEEERICLDGASYEISMAGQGRRYSARQHSCADPSELDQIMGVFRSVALAHDPKSEGLLFGLNRATRAKQ